ncbi:MAG TPA: hypothetical protein VF699_11910 [Caulobacteraceae bacterium]|jgi:hypothetical protein
MIRTGLSVAAAALMLSGCLNLSRTAIVASAPAAVVRDGRVERIVLAAKDIGARPELEAIFQQRVKAKLERCATGATPLRLEAVLDRVDKTNPVVTALLFGANVLRGAATLVREDTGEVVGQYQIGRTIVGRGPAAIAMAEAEEQLSDAYGEELCKAAFTPAK